jgi:hypothetical protein
MLMPYACLHQHILKRVEQKRGSGATEPRQVNLLETVPEKGMY